MLTLQRQFATATALSVSYVGTQGHHLMVIEEANSATPSVCLSVSQPSEVAPNYTPGKLLLHANPRKGGTYFHTSLFRVKNLEQFGDAARRFFHGPGLNDWDIALLKNIPIRESKTLEFRAEWFNAFNHTQFNTADGNIRRSDQSATRSHWPTSHQVCVLSHGQTQDLSEE